MPQNPATSSASGVTFLISPQHAKLYMVASRIAVVCAGGLPQVGEGLPLLSTGRVGVSPL